MSPGTQAPDIAFLDNVPTSISSLSLLTSISATTSKPLTSSLSSVASATFAASASTVAAAAASASATGKNGVESTSIYFYKPSVPFAIVFSVAFFLLVPYHFYLSIWKPCIAKSVAQKHKYTIPLFVAAVLATVGFSLRIASVSSVSGRASVGLYASSASWIIVSPIFVCATLYLLLAHLVRRCLPLGQEQVFLHISPKWFGRIFITSDVISFLSQGAGSGVAASGDWEGSQKDTGEAILLFGLSMQLVTFTVYMTVLVMFCLRVSKGYEGAHELLRRNEQANDRDFGFNPLVKQVVRGMWIASVLVEIRTIYRTVEFGMGIDGYLFQHEWPLCLEAIPMFFALLVLGVYHPTNWLQGKRRSQFVEKAQNRGEDSQQEEMLPQQRQFN